MPPPVPNNGTVMYWKLKPHEKVTYTEEHQRLSSDTDAAGIWRLPATAREKVCVSR
ncbi:MAG: hypothetical protein JOZ62_23030 [Acidobacteriaceae bacterium]|nr:hypothetical protein [Acidobacteriaceae bacterium]